MVATQVRDTITTEGGNVTIFAAYGEDPYFQMVKELNNARFLTPLYGDM